ncbi:hypothetical protein BJF92_21195 [Rhizobium rhizosphaerae]|uniref:Uncharacterized protein n=1 Tax=Xaviernesmea rhizosphaerae TaxID=1672749 RepID=A0A1Q9ANQ6_9HYPH|nr:hypothetical protein [Xaviernesmea rhizosphaerae]OLP57026.1 hypothetical protein BJF92_21195 [Xaviernesmea rhizosphaerae]
MSDFISMLFAIFVVNPLQAEVSDRLRGVAVNELIGAGRACIAAEGPRLLERAQANWGWAAANAIGVSFGMVDPATLLSGDNADCRRVLPLLRQNGERSNA